MGFIASSPQWVVYSYSINATIVLVAKLWCVELGEHGRSWLDNMSLDNTREKKPHRGSQQKHEKMNVWWFCPINWWAGFCVSTVAMEDALPEIPNLPLKIPPGNMAPLGLLQKSWALCWALIFSHACGPVQRSEIRGRVFFVGRSATWLTVDHVFSPRIFSMLKPKKNMGLNLLIRCILFQYAFFMLSEPQETLTIFIT